MPPRERTSKGSPTGSIPSETLSRQEISSGIPDESERKEKEKKENPTIHGSEEIIASENEKRVQDENEVEQIETILDRFSKELDSLRKDLENNKGMSDNYTRETSELSRLMDRQSLEYDRITNELDRRRKELDKLRLMLQNIRYSSRGTTMGKQMETAKNKLSIRERKIQQIEEEYRDLEKELRKKKDIADENDMELDTLSTKLERLRWLLKQQEVDRERNMKKIEELRKENENFKREITKAREQTENNAREAADKVRVQTANEIEAERKRADEIEAELQKLQDHEGEESLSAQKNETKVMEKAQKSEEDKCIIMTPCGGKEHANKMDDDSKSATSNITFDLQKIESLQTEAELQKLNSHKYQSEVERLKKENEIMDQEIERTRRFIRDLPFQAQKMLDEQKKLMETCDVDKEQAINQFNDLKTKITRAEANLASMQYDLLSKDAALQREQDIAHTIMMETDTLSAEKRTAKANVERYKSEKESVLEKVNTTKKCLESARKEFLAYKESALGPEEAAFLKDQFEHVKKQLVTELEAEKERRLCAEKYYHGLKTKLESDYRSALDREHHKVKSLQNRLMSRESSDTSTRECFY